MYDIFVAFILCNLTIFLRLNVFLFCFGIRFLFKNCSVLVVLSKVGEYEKGGSPEYVYKY